MNANALNAEKRIIHIEKAIWSSVIAGNTVPFAARKWHLIRLI
jgi:hypothetical protein